MRAPICGAYHAKSLILLDSTSEQLVISYTEKRERKGRNSRVFFFLNFEMGSGANPHGPPAGTGTPVDLGRADSEYSPFLEMGPKIRTGGL
jgi:hypothetical protein